ncbi:MAG: hypothetical protein RLZ58_2223 [Pseudomonadota bacterium]|jgi:ribonuclease T1
MPFGAAYKFALTSLMAVALLSGGQATPARTPGSPDELPRIALTELPPQGRDTYRLIRQGGPFPYEKDGTVFGNRERLLPLHPRGYYREYTVRTPRSKDRGARRIVCGGPPTTPEACYYTADHYASFRRIVE